MTLKWEELLIPQRQRGPAEGSGKEIRGQSPAVLSIARASVRFHISNRATLRLCTDWGMRGWRAERDPGVLVNKLNMCVCVSSVSWQAGEPTVSWWTSHTESPAGQGRGLSCSALEHFGVGCSSGCHNIRKVSSYQRAKESNTDCWI